MAKKKRSDSMYKPLTVPESTHRLLKKKSAEEGVLLGDLVVELIKLGWKSKYGKLPK